MSEQVNLLEVLAFEAGRESGMIEAAEVLEKKAAECDRHGAGIVGTVAGEYNRMACIYRAAAELVREKARGK